uniref:Uncharacterized protein n=1 Tax=Solanum lycopersicum TaxID=4081 RepID=A0A3Q7ID14_SOLLC
MSRMILSFMRIRTTKPPPQIKMFPKLLTQQDPGPDQVGVGVYSPKHVHLDPRRKSLGCSSNPTQERIRGNHIMGNVWSHRKAHFSLWVIRRASLYDQGPGHKCPSAIHEGRTSEVTAMSINLTHRIKQ